jgi:hypothetical protein
VFSDAKYQSSSLGRLCSKQGPFPIMQGYNAKGFAVPYNKEYKASYTWKKGQSGRVIWVYDEYNHRWRHKSDSFAQDTLIFPDDFIDASNK